MRTPIPPDEQDFSPQGEFSEEEAIEPIYNPATANSPIPMDEDEWLASFGGILDIFPEYNPVTMDITRSDYEE